MQNTGANLSAGFVILAVAAHFILQMVFSPAWVNLSPLLAAVVALTLLPDRAAIVERPALRAAIVAIGCFLASYVLSLAFSTNRGASLDTLLALLPGPLLFALLLQLQRQHTRQVAMALNAGVLAGSAYLIVLLLAFGELSPSFGLLNHYTASFVVPNDALFLVCLAPFSLHLLLYQDSRAMRVSGAIGLVCIAAVVVLSTSRAGLLVAAAVLAVYALTRSRGPMLLGIPALAVALLLVDWSQDFPFLQKLLSTDTLGHRLLLWWAGIEGFLEHPLTGHGPGTFEVMYDKLIYSGRLPEDLVYDNRSIGWAHSLYVEALAERGIPGLVTLLGFFGAALVPAIRGLRGASRDSWLFPVLVSLLALMFAGALELTFMRTWVVSLSFLLLGLCVMQSEGTPAAG